MRKSFMHDDWIDRYCILISVFQYKQFSQEQSIACTRKNSCMQSESENLGLQAFYTLGLNKGGLIKGRDTWEEGEGAY